MRAKREIIMQVLLLLLPVVACLAWAHYFNERNIIPGSRKSH